MSVSHATVVSVTFSDDLSGVESLRRMFSQLKDPRKPRGVRHPLAGVLTLVVAAVLCGAANFRQAADRIKEMPQSLLAAAGARLVFPALGVRMPPCRDTLRRVVEAIDAQAADRLTCLWLAARLPAVVSGVGLALDGKTVRHSTPDRFDPDANVELFAAMRHDTGVVVAQVRVPADTTEVTQIDNLLHCVNLTGMVITADAAHPSAATAAYLRKRGADYALTVKANKPALQEAIWSRLPAATDATVAHIDRRHANGKTTERRIWIAAADGIDYPDAKTVFRIRRDTFDPSGQRTSKDLVVGITSLTSPAVVIAAHIQNHWGIENKIHWVRDVLFREDHHHAYLGAVAHTMGLLRNFAIGLLRLAGHTKIKQVLEQHHGDKTLIPKLLRTVEKLAT